MVGRAGKDDFKNLGFVLGRRIAIVHNGQKFNATISKVGKNETSGTPQLGVVSVKWAENEGKMPSANSHSQYALYKDGVLVEENAEDRESPVSFELLPLDGEHKCKDCQETFCCGEQKDSAGKIVPKSKCYKGCKKGYHVDCPKAGKQSIENSNPTESKPVLKPPVVEEKSKPSESKNKKNNKLPKQRCFVKDCSNTNFVEYAKASGNKDPIIYNLCQTHHEIFSSKTVCKSANCWCFKGDSGNQFCKRKAHQNPNVTLNENKYCLNCRQEDNERKRKKYNKRKANNGTSANAPLLKKPKHIDMPIMLRTSDPAVLWNLHCSIMKKGLMTRRDGLEVCKSSSTAEWELYFTTVATKLGLVGDEGTAQQPKEKAKVLYDVLYGVFDTQFLRFKTKFKNIQKPTYLEWFNICKAEGNTTAQVASPTLLLNE